MSETTAIEWCDSTFNPWIGCTKISTAVTGGGGCENCYAEVSTPVRVLRSKGIETWDAHAPRQRTSPSNWSMPESWERQHEAFYAEHGRRRRVFCASLADVFDNQAPQEWRTDLFTLIRRTPHLDWLLLTKRIGNVRGMVPATWLERGGWPAHVRLMITVVTQEEADRDIAKLVALGCPNGLSMEPLLGPIKLPRFCACGCRLPVEAAIREAVDSPTMPNRDQADAAIEKTLGIDWVIAGGESGPHARPSHPDWFRSLRDQCAAARVPFMFKQWGGWIPADQASAARAAQGFHPIREFRQLEGDRMHRIGKRGAGRLLDGVEHNGFPEDAC